MATINKLFNINVLISDRSYRVLTIVRNFRRIAGKIFDQFFIVYLLEYP